MQQASAFSGEGTDEWKHAISAGSERVSRDALMAAMPSEPATAKGFKAVTLPQRRGCKWSRAMTSASIVAAKRLCMCEIRIVQQPLETEHEAVQRSMQQGCCAALQ